MIRKLYKNQVGDTIIEVLICIAVLGFVLSASYSLSTRSQTLNLQAQERNVASRLVDKQIELLRGFIDRYGIQPPNTYFCVDPNFNSVASPLTAIKDISDPTDPTTFPPECKSPPFYNAAIYHPGPQAQAIGADDTETYAVRILWDSAGKATQDEVKLFYKVSDITSSAFDSVAVDAECRDGVNNDGSLDSISSPGSPGIDMDDPGCSSPTDTDESDNPACSDGLDNDGDGKKDFGSGAGKEPATDCTDSQDNDESTPLTTYAASIVAYANCYNGCPDMKVTWYWSDGTSTSDTVTVSAPPITGASYSFSKTSASTVTLNSVAMNMVSDLCGVDPDPCDLAHDRNLYIRSLTVNGNNYQHFEGSYLGCGGGGWPDNFIPAFYTGNDATFLCDLSVTQFNLASIGGPYLANGSSAASCTAIPPATFGCASTTSYNNSTGAGYFSYGDIDVAYNTSGVSAGSHILKLYYGNYEDDPNIPPHPKPSDGYTFHVGVSVNGGPYSYQSLMVPTGVSSWTISSGSPNPTIRIRWDNNYWITTGRCTAIYVNGCDPNFMINQIRIK